MTVAKWNTILAVLLLSILSYTSVQAQLQIGVQGGGNLSKAIGDEFRSINRIGFQFGAFFTYGLSHYFALQAEPTYVNSRVRTNDYTISLPDGVHKATFSLNYFNLPLLAKLTITPQFALLGGLEFTKLINDDAYRLNNGMPVFGSGISAGYALGAELGKLYFRYRRQPHFSEINRPNNAYIQQLQLGIRFRLM